MIRKLPRNERFKTKDLRPKSNNNIVLFCSLLILAIYVLFSPSISYAQFKTPQGSFTTEVSASVGKFYLSLSGWISPYASVVLTSEGIFLRAAVADSSGKFYISQVLIKQGFSKFCLEAVDFKRLGSSYTCFDIPPATGNVDMKDIFLPPTLGLSRTEIGFNESATAFGYTMPGAKVKLYLSDGRILEAMADQSGYYELKVDGLKAGDYTLYARAELNNIESLKPTKVLGLKSLSWWQLVIKFFKDLWDKIVRFFTSFALGPLWLAIPAIILIIILILKLWPEKFSFIYESKLLAWLPWFGKKKKKPLHHAWFIGY